MPSANYLIRDLRTHNPWWTNDEAAFEGLPRTKKSDFYRYTGANRDREGYFSRYHIFGLVGPLGVGKTTLVKQFIQYKIREEGFSPDRFLYIPWNDDPLYQLQPRQQMRQAVDYYETRILREDPSKIGEHYLIFDDIHAISQHRPDSTPSWGEAIVDILQDAPDRHIILSGTTEAQLDQEVEPVADDLDYTSRIVISEKFKDFIQAIHPKLRTGEDRLSPTPLRQGETGLPAACKSDDPAQFFGTLEEIFEQIRPYASEIRPHVVDYLALGGILGMQGASEQGVEFENADYDRHLENLRLTIYQEVPGFESIRNLRDLERLCAFAANERVNEPIQYQELTKLFEVDRRTLRESYFSTLSELFVLTPSEEYDNSRPRAVRLYLRDTGLVNAFYGKSVDDIVDDYDYEAELAHIAAFDHTIRLEFGMNASAAREFDDVSFPEEPSVTYWRSDSDEVDLVFDCAGRPIPIGLAYQPGSVASKTDAVREFRETYEAPVGLVVTGDMAETDPPLEILPDDRIARLPYWFYLMIC